MPVLVAADQTAAEAAAAADLELGLVNNMPDAALEATERQFLRVLEAASGPRLVRVHLLALPGVPRSPETRARMAARYTVTREPGRSFDGLIVTGTEPRALLLSDEPYWEDLRGLADWADHNTLSTIWSCLAAHAAVLAIDGIARRPFGEKCTGVFQSRPVAESQLFVGAPEALSVFHSRYNDLDGPELAAAGYRILAQADGAGVDIFEKVGISRFIFLQGHPEYGPDALGREYRRDVNRFLSGERETYPAMPAHYLDANSFAALERFRLEALAERRPGLVDRLPSLGVRPHLAGALASSAALLYRNWLSEMLDRRPAATRSVQHPMTASSV